MRPWISDMLWQKLKVLSVIIAASFLLSGIAFYNGYPLVYPDTDCYIGLHVNLLRSFFYNLFIFLSSWFQSLWPVVFLQSLIVAHLLYLALRVVFGVTSHIAYLVVIALMCLLTNLPWFTGFIMPDIFTGVMILSLYLLIFCRKNIGLWERRYLFLLTIMSATVHLTHIPLALGMIVIIWFIRLIIKNKSLLPVPHLLSVSLAIMLSFILIVVNNYRMQGSLTLSPGGYSYLLARFVADGSAVKYLKASCPERKYKLCDYLDQLPADSDEFFFSVESPFRKVGGIDGYGLEGTEIVKQTLFHYPFLIIKDSLTNTLLQLPLINNWYGICSYIQFPYPTEKIRNYYPADFHAYAHSRQSLNLLFLNYFNHLHRIVIGLSLLISVVMFLLLFKLKQRYPAYLFIIIVCAYGISSFITGTFSVPHNRFGSRIIWLLPFFSIASLMHFLNHRKEYFRIMIESVNLKIDK